MTSKAYPGNPSLAPEVRQRVIATFVQTLSLYDEVKLDEVVAGCDLILEMDDRFEPAKKLRQKAKDPSAPIDLTELYALRDSPPAAASTGPTPEAEHGPSGEAGDSEALVLDAVERMNRGEYQEAIDICNGILSRDPGNEEAQRIGQQAYEMLEAAPFVKQYIEEASSAIDRGDHEAAATAVASARSLDPFHPKVSELESRIDAMKGTSEPESSSGVGFDFGGGDSPFSGAFAGAGAPESPATPTPPEEDTGFSVGGTEEESPATEFSFSSEAESSSPAPDSDDAAPAPDVPLMGEAAPEATGFGFTLEPADEPEESAPAASPEPEAIPGESHTFDFSTAGVEVGSEDQQKVQGYIAEGDALFDSGDYQGAIDAWSRVFLIDVTNEEASERIDKAKAKKRESESKLDELLGTGIAAYEGGNYTTARQTFEEVLAQDPDNFRAREYLDKLDDHSAATGAAPAPATGIEEDLYEGEPLEDVYEEPQPAAAPARGARKAPSSKPAPKAPAPARKSQKGLLIAVAVIAAVAVGGWFAWTTFRGDGTSATDPAITQGKINRAELLAEDGDYAQAIAVLRTIEPGDPMRDQAMEMIANYRQRQAETGGMIGGRPLNEVREELLSHAREAFAAEDYMQARSSFEEAAKLRALDPEDRQMYDAATRQVSKLDTATTLFRQGSYRDAIQELENILEEEPDNLNARQMLANAHYNLGVLAFREQQLDEAIRRFTIVVEQNPGDEMARRSLQIAQRYRNNPKDLLYQIYVKYLPLR